MLHATAWRETSLIVQTFSRDHGCVAMVAKGAKRPYSVLRPVLSAFQPLLLSWTGNGEVKTLTRAEIMGVRALNGTALMSAWYMNELLLRLLPREDAHPLLFDAYDMALQQLSGGTRAAGALRRFEWTLLRETGYGVDEAEPDFDDRSPARTRCPPAPNRCRWWLSRRAASTATAPSTHWNAPDGAGASLTKVPT